LYKSLMLKRGAVSAIPVVRKMMQYLPYVLLAAFVLSCLNAYVRPLLDYLLMPIAELTFGLTMFLNSAIMVFLTSLIVGGFKVYGFYGALMFSTCLLLAQNITITPFEQATANKK